MYGDLINSSRDAYNKAVGQSQASFNTYNQYAGQADTAKGQYDDRYSNRVKDYDTFWNKGRETAMNQWNSDGQIDKAKVAYEDARDTLNSVNASIRHAGANALGGFGGRDVSQSAINAIMNRNMNQLSNTAANANTTYTQAGQDYNRLMDLVARSQSELATGNYQSQEDDLNRLFSVWDKLLSQRNVAYSQHQSDKGLEGDALGALNTWRDAQNQYNERQAALAREMAERARDREQTRIQMEKNRNKDLYGQLMGTDFATWARMGAPTGSGGQSLYADNVDAQRALANSVKMFQSGLLSPSGFDTRNNAQNQSYKDYLDWKKLKAKEYGY